LAALLPRLERLNNAERTMLEAASVVGDIFASEAVAAVIAAEAQSPPLEEVETLCERLVQHRDVLRTSEVGAPYGFRHALYRQALYEGIAPARRRRMHARVAAWQAASRPAGSSEGAAELADHFARAGDDAQAACYHAEAAAAARARFADREVASHLSAALTHLRRAPRTAGCDSQELILIQQFGAASLAANGFGDGEIALAYRRAQRLAARIEMPLAHFAASSGLLCFHLMRAELDAAATLAAELNAAAPSLPLPMCATAAQAAIGTVLFCRGDLIGARLHLEGLRDRFPRRDANFPFDPALWYLGMLSMLHAGLGEPEAARAICADLLASAAGGTPFDVAGGHTLVASVEAQLHNPPLVLEHAQAAMRMAGEYDFPVLVSSAGQLRGWALAVSGDTMGGVRALGDGEAAFRASGQRLGLPFLAMLRAEAYLCADDRVAAEAEIGAGLEHANATGEHRQDSDLYRLRAECLRRTGRMDEAAAALDAALEVAAQQGAKLAELRAAIDSVRLRRSRSSSAAVAKRLAGVAARFDAGARLPELSVAAALLRGRLPVPSPRALAGSYLARN
jgi:hypothetical protein